MLERKSGKEFRETGLLWFINTILHGFGYALVWNSETDEIYPARVKFRGFDEDTNTKGYKAITGYLKDSIEELEKEANS